MQPESTPSRPRLTVGILTLNEARRIASCINSAKFADQIVVVDSGSKDQTREIAAALGAEVHNYPDWQGFAVQRNRVLQHAKGEYVFFLDADEEMPPAMHAEIEAVVAAGKDESWVSLALSRVRITRYRISAMKQMAACARLRGCAVASGDKSARSRFQT